MARKKAKSEAKSEAPKKIKPISLNILEIAKRLQKLEQTSGGGDHSALANKSDIATEFNSTTAYTAGCFVYHEGKLYQFNADHAAGAWDPTDVVVANITDQVVSNKAAIAGLTASDVSYDNTTSGLSATKVQGAVDELATSYPATNVIMSDGVTSVENRLDANSIGTPVNISNYTSSNPYVIPSDGYVRLVLEANATGRIFINNQWLAGTERNMSYVTFSVFVKKGMTTYMDNITNATPHFYPIQTD